MLHVACHEFKPISERGRCDLRVDGGGRRIGGTNIAPLLCDRIVQHDDSIGEAPLHVFNPGAELALFQAAGESRHAEMKLTQCHRADEQRGRVLKLHPSDYRWMRLSLDALRYNAGIEKEHQNTLRGFSRFRGGSLNSGTFGADNHQSTSVAGFAAPAERSLIKRTSNFGLPR